MDRQVKYVLQESDLPRQWYNIVPDLPAPPPPPLHPGTGQPIGPDDLAPLFPGALIAQEVSGDSHVDIPDDVVDVYRLWRPTPLFRARRLERDLASTRAAARRARTSPTPRCRRRTTTPRRAYAG